MVRELDSLVRLQGALTENRVSREQLDGVPESMRDLHADHQSRFEKIQALEERIRDAELGRRASEASAQDAQARLKRFHEQVNQVSTQREYGALLSEIDEAKAAVLTHEDEALLALEEAEDAQSLLDAERTDFEDLDQRYQEELKQWEAQKPSVQKRLREVEAEIEELRAHIPQALMVRFERLFERLNGEALAAISKAERTAKSPDVWHCSNCNYRVRPQVVVDIKTNGNLNQCESCQRFLYWQEES